MSDKRPISIFTKNPVQNDGSGLYSEYQTLQLDEFNQVVTDENGKTIQPVSIEECPDDLMEAFLDDAFTNDFGG